MSIVTDARAWVDVDVDAVRANYTTVRDRARPRVGVVPMVKADGYGHGAVPLARRLLAEGVEMIGVGDSSEAIELREAVREEISPPAGGM